MYFKHQIIVLTSWKFTGTRLFVKFKTLCNLGRVLCQNITRRFVNVARYLLSVKLKRCLKIRLCHSNHLCKTANGRNSC